MTATIELSDELLEQANAMAARRNTTLSAVVEDALRREIAAERPLPDDDPGFVIDEDGLPRLTKKSDVVVTSEMVYKMMEELGI